MSMNEIISNALIAGIGISLIAGLLGCFVVWRRMAYFGDSLAHSALLGVGFGMLSGISDNLAIMLVAGVFAILLNHLKSKNILSTDTLLGILAHASLAFGMILLALQGEEHFDLHEFLFGDILKVSLNQIIWISIAVIVTYSLIFVNWQNLILLTINNDLAKSMGLKIYWLELMLIFLLTLIVAISVKIIGVLLITSMLIIPAATAKQCSKSPISMAILSVIVAFIAMIIGVFMSLNYNIPAGPAIVSVIVIEFMVFSFFKKIVT
jgi:zinc transport system permease protein